MADKQHPYPVEVVWTGNHGTGTKTYQGYGREKDAHHACFIANSVSFPLRCEPRIVIESP